MNVTKENFESVVVELENCIPTADFIAIDEEMTGIRIPGARETDTQLPFDRYQTMRKVATTYKIIQFGICTFHRVDNKIVAKPYNFYVFPATGLVTLEGDAIAFNVKHNMDFNMWFRQGINYVDKKQHQQLLEQYEAMNQKNASTRTPQQMPTVDREDDRNFLKEVHILVTSWLKKGSEHALILAPCNAFRRLLVRCALEKSHPDLVVDSVGERRGWRALSVMKLTPEQKQERENLKHAERQAELFSKVGFRRIFLAMTKCKKLVGHNCLYDLMFMMHSFHELPPTLPEFKQVVQECFPVVCDTKHIASLRSNDRVLQQLRASAQSKKELELKGAGAN